MAVTAAERELRMPGPRPVLTLLELGRYLIEQGSYADAARALQRRLRLAPHDWEAQYLLGLAIFRDGDARRADEQLAVLAEQRAVDSATCQALARALDDLDEPNRARRWYRAALDVDPALNTARLRLREIEAQVSSRAHRGRRWVRRLRRRQA